MSYQISKSVNCLPFLNEDTWTDFRSELGVRPNNEMKEVTQLIYRKCQYTINKITITDLKSLLNVQGPIMVQTSGDHCIALYNKMIFDANMKKTRKATLEDLSAYPYLKIRNEIEMKNFKRTVYKLSPNIKKMKGGQMKATL